MDNYLAAGTTLQQSSSIDQNSSGTSGQSVESQTVGGTSSIGSLRLLSLQNSGAIKHIPLGPVPQIHHRFPASSTIIPRAFSIQMPSVTRLSQETDEEVFPRNVASQINDSVPDRLDLKMDARYSEQKFDENGSFSVDAPLAVDHWSDIANQNAQNVTSINDDSISGHSNIDKRASDKTPMCLIASLAKYNNVPHQYKLINEVGPAHQKSFTVALILGNGDGQEEFMAQGASIKKAQQAAAEKAMEETKLPKPKPQRFNHKRRPTAATYGYSSMENASLTPTVMLNAATMKLGMKPEYTFLNSPYPIMSRCPGIRPPPVYCNNPSFRPYRQNVPFSVPPPPPRQPAMPFHNLLRCAPPFRFQPSAPIIPHYVKLKIGDHEFIGQGPNRQLAKHDASLKALRILEPRLQQADNHMAKSTPDASEQHPPSGKEKDIPQRLLDGNGTDENTSLQQMTDNKSAINIVYEFALRRHLAVDFEVLSESGPAHKPRFVVRCVVKGTTISTLTTEGEGTSKKLAKHDASEKMIKQLDSIKIDSPKPAVVRLPEERQPMHKLGKDKRRKQTIVKDMKSDPNYGHEINPVSRLIQIQQTKREGEPVYEFVREEGHARSKEFLMKVSIGEETCEGKGPNKKLAKRAAAEAMLAKLGYAKPLPTPGKPLLKRRQSGESSNVISGDEDSSQPTNQQSSEDNNKTNLEASTPQIMEKPRRVKFQLSNDTEKNPIAENFERQDDSRNNNGQFQNRGNRRLAPGLFFMPSLFADVDKEEQAASYSGHLTEPIAEASLPTSIPQMQNRTNSQTSSNNDAKDQLFYLSSLLSFHVQFTDFPKSLRNGEGGEFLSLVSLSTNPPLVCHGSGPSTEHAQNDAALAALRSLATKGLEMAGNAKSQAMNVSNVTPVDVGSHTNDEQCPSVDECGSRKQDDQLEQSFF